MQFVDSFIGHDLSPTFNSRGHRCKEIEEVDLRNYILFAGDNVSLGWDKPIERTYPFIASQKIGCDYYNLSIFNGGIDAMKYNLLTWFAKVPQRPKAIVISCEFLNSFFTANDSFEKWQVCDYDNETVKEIFDTGNKNGYFLGKRVLANMLLTSYIDKPIYQITFKNKIPAFDSNIINLNYDDSEINHAQIAQLISHQFTKTTTRMLP